MATNAGFSSTIWPLSPESLEAVQRYIRSATKMGIGEGDDGERFIIIEYKTIGFNGGRLIENYDTIKIPIK